MEYLFGGSYSLIVVCIQHTLVSKTWNARHCKLDFFVAAVCFMPCINRHDEILI